MNETLSPLKTENLFDPFSSDFDPLAYSKGQSHFQIAFCFILSAEKRKALDELYAFCRIADDISDGKDFSESEKQMGLQRLRHWVRNRMPVAHPFWDSFLIHRLVFSVPDSSLLGILDGVQIDSHEGAVRMRDWDELNRYCHGVAGCVGEAVLHVLEAGSSHAQKYSEMMGRCLQYLNIMRDLDEDKKENRLYVPQEFLKSLGVLDEDFPSQKFYPTIREELYQRAQKFYEEATPYSWKCLPAEIMASIYWDGSRKYWKNGNSRKLSKRQKMVAAIRTCIRFIFGLNR